MLHEKCTFEADYLYSECYSYKQYVVILTVLRREFVHYIWFQVDAMQNGCNVIGGQS
jgi:hypothetical protein